MNFEKSDIITCESYKPLCDYVYKVENTDPPAGLVHVNMEEIPYFFKVIKNYPERKYVVVSSCSDFGVCFQEFNPVWYDMGKWIKMMAGPTLGYQKIVADPRCDLSKCNIEDKYSVKCYSFTAFTFPEIPANIAHWFMTNSKLLPQEEPRVTVIPFGVAGNSADAIMEVAQEVQGYEKEPKIYVNWMDYTLERFELKQYLRLVQDNSITIVDEAKPYKSYLRDLARHSVVLSPEGNGIDCYRTLETLYMGSMPVVMVNPTTIALSDLPIALIRSMYAVNAEQLHKIYLMFQTQNRSLDKIKLSHWKKTFNNVRLIFSV